MSEATQVTEFLKVTTRLIGVLEREIDMLRAMKPSEIQSLQQDKIVLSAAYEAQVKALKGDPEILRGVSPDLRADLKSVIERFQSTLSENERGLRAARDVSERVLRAIADELEQRQNKNKGYAPAGPLPASPRGTASRPLSVAYDERL